MGSKIGKCLIRQRQSIYTMLSKFCSKTAILTVFTVIMMITALIHMNEKRNMLKLLEKSSPKIVKNEVHSKLEVEREYPMIVENGPVEDLLEVVAFNEKPSSHMKRKMGMHYVASHSSSDEELLEVVELLPNVRNYRIKLDAFNYFSDDEFKTRYRFTKETVVKICELIAPNYDIVNNRGRPISKIDQLLVALRFYATGAFQNVIGDIAHMHKSSICKIVKKITHHLALLRPQFIKMPRNEEILETKNDFFKIRRFPNVIGCVDCTHVRIQSPGGDQAELYRNRKGYFSINVQAICNASLEFQEVTARWRGSVHDSTIFNASQICADFEGGSYPNSYLLGDSGYPCRSYLLTPLLQPNSEAERRYNVSHISTRNTIERAFGVWKRRFPCLALCLRTKISTTVSIIIATAVLHNIAVRENELEPRLGNQEEEHHELEEVPLIEQGIRNDFAVRNNVIATVFGN